MPRKSKGSGGAGWLRGKRKAKAADLPVESGSEGRRSPSESSEQRQLMNHLDRCGILAAAIPNGGKRDSRTARNMVAEGVKKGVPDVLIFDVPEGSEAKGCALEMKRADGVPSDVSPHQRRWLSRLKRKGWIAVVGYGYADAISKLRGEGYAV